MKEGKGKEFDYPNAGGSQRLFGLLLMLEPSIIPKQVRDCYETFEAGS